jgi:hypothetical protein
MRARLRQSVRLIVDRRRDLGIRLDRIRASLIDPRSDQTVLSTSCSTTTASTSLF